MAWEEIERAGAGRWVEQSADAMASALESILVDPVEARAMGQRGRALAARSFTWTASARILADVYARNISVRPAVRAS